MLGLTSSLLLSLPPCLSECIGDFDIESLLIALRVSSNLQIITKVVYMTPGHTSVLTALIRASLPYLTCCSTRWGCFPHRSLVYQQSPVWSSCPCGRHGGVLEAPPPLSAAFHAHRVTTTDWNQWQSNQSHHQEPAFSWHWDLRGQ